MTPTACSPGLCPREGIRYPAALSEKRVFESLQSSLPPGWYAWHSFKLCAEGHDFAEADFLIASPAHGVLILEVKGGAIRKESGAWFQNGKPMDRSPLAQAHRVRNILLHRFDEFGMPAPAIGLAICFPDTPVDESLTQDDMAGCVIGSESLPYLDRILPDLIDRVIPQRRIIPGGWISQLHAMWCESWIPTRRLSRRKAEDSETRIRLDQEQMKILDMAGGNDRVIVQGSPGTGKTILAMELAQREAAQGRRVLFLCFAEALGQLVNVKDFSTAQRSPGVPEPEEALETGVLVVTEVSEGGSVPNLKVANKGDIAVLLFNGWELAGAKQNRVLNTSLLVKEKTEIVVPVS